VSKKVLEMMKEFIANHEVFTIKELDRYLSMHGSGNFNTRKALLAYYLKQGRLISVKRGLFAVVPLGGAQGDELKPVLLQLRHGHCRSRLIHHPSLSHSWRPLKSEISVNSDCREHVLSALLALSLLGNSLKQAALHFLPSGVMRHLFCVFARGLACPLGFSRPPAS